MPITSYLVGTTIAVLFTGTAWGLVLIYFDPTTTGVIGLSLFLVSFCLTAIGLTTLILYAVYRRLLGDGRFWTALRHGSWFGLAGTAWLGLQWLHVAHWWNGLMLLVVIILLEAYFRIKMERTKDSRNGRST